jgi:hypothetical protein
MWCRVLGSKGKTANRNLVRDVVNSAAKTWYMVQRPRLMSKDKGCRLVCGIASAIIR